MTKTFTEQDLIKYLYSETTEKEAKAISHALISDTSLRTMFNELRNVIGQLDEARLDPAPSTMLNILSYSKSTAVKE